MFKELIEEADYKRELGVIRSSEQMSSKQEDYFKSSSNLRPFGELSKTQLLNKNSMLASMTPIHNNKY